MNEPTRKREEKDKTRQRQIRNENEDAHFSVPYSKTISISSPSD